MCKARVRNNILHVSCFHVFNVITTAWTRKKSFGLYRGMVCCDTEYHMGNIVLYIFSSLTMYINEVF